MTAPDSASSTSATIVRQDTWAETAGFQWGWSLRYASGNLGAGLMFAFANAALPLYLAGYGLPNAAIGLLAQDRPPLAGLSQIVVGALSDRTRSRLGRRRPYLLFGVPAAAIALLGLALHPPVWLAIGVLVLFTTALAVAYGPYLALLADLVPGEVRGRVGGLQAAANMIGQMSMLWMASQFWSDQESLVFALGAAGLLLAFGITFFGVSESTGGLAEHPASIRFAPLEYVHGILAEREVAKYLLATLFYWLGAGGVVPFLTRFAVNELGTDESTAFQLLMVPVLATVVCTWPAGWLGDRLGKKPVLIAGLALMGVSVMIGSQVQTVAQAIAGLTIVGIANALCTVLLFPLLTDLLPAERAGEFTGLGAGVWELAQPLGAVIGGLAADATGTLRATFLLAAILTLVSAALLTLVHAPAINLQPGPATRLDGEDRQPASPA